ncbi:hypothetical protein B0J11DRAFT_475007 [Dendryphion nanum]|uniref:Uncharacterized protein n=1 Tax=Dendryphion nanum TaxID=256645 RepID=A0A9P9EGP3_9PLEO|nr:hypothetical protein B0J11DRAFT_475007 [Dendryphion nanum]
MTSHRSSATESFDSNTSVAYTPSSTSVTTTTPTEVMEALDTPHSSVPWPGSTYIIQLHDTDSVITFLDGKIVLAPPGGHGNYRWRCVETENWLGFRDPASGLYIGYDKVGLLRCRAKAHNEWERICIRQRPEGGYIMLMTFWEALRRVGVRTDSGRAHIGKVEEAHNCRTTWIFIKVGNI